MTHVAHEDVKDMVTRIVKTNRLTVLEGHHFVALSNHIGRLKTHFNGKLGPACHLVIAVGSLNIKVRARWMVARLLHEYIGAVLSTSLVSLAKNRVQRLLEDFLFVEEGQTVGHQKLHDKLLSYGRKVSVLGKMQKKLKTNLFFRKSFILLCLNVGGCCAVRSWHVLCRRV